jgi:hypothetical protein
MPLQIYGEGTSVELAGLRVFPQCGRDRGGDKVGTVRATPQCEGGAMTARRTALIPLLTLAIGLPLAPSADAASARLMFDGCQSSAAGPSVAGCTQLEGFERPGALAFSADGRSAYAGIAARLLVFDRDTAGGALSLAQCLGAGPDTGCTQATGIVGTIVDIAVPRDGTSVYTASDQNRLLGFRRDPRDGRLTWNSCLYSSYGAQGDLPNCPVGTFQETRQVEVSRDGRGVYLRDYGCADNTGDCFAGIVSYERNPLTSALTRRDYSGPATAGDGPFALSPHGGTLYELDSASGAISVFKRIGAAGLRRIQCLWPARARGCERRSRMDRARQLALSPDGHRLITAIGSRRGAGRLGLFKRARNGKLAFRDCIAPAGTGAARHGCRSLGPTRGFSLARIDQLEFSPDGRSLYAVTDEAGGRALLRFKVRRRRGTLGLAQCLTGSPRGGCTQVPQLDGLDRIALTGRFVYAISAGGGGTLVRFRAENG